MIEFIFMLTHHDRTIADARKVFEVVRGVGLRYIGFKDIGAEPEELADITRAARADGMEVMLEVVSTAKEDELKSLRLAVEIGVDWVLGGTHAEDGIKILGGTALRYCPFPGDVRDHPSVLVGEIEEIAEQSRALTSKPGVYGLDLLAYRHVSADPLKLTRAVVEAAFGPVIAAGSVASVEQIQGLARAGAWGFTIGGAIFEGRLPGGPDVATQVRNVLQAARELPGTSGH